MKDKIILGKKAIYTFDADINNNVVVFATTGAGKTKSIIEPTLLNIHNSSLVVSVAKRELIDRYKGIFIERGYQVLDLNLLSNDSPIGYDPMQYIKNESDIINLAQAIISYGCTDFSAVNDPYWYQSAISFLASLIGLIWEYQCNPLHIKMSDIPGEIAPPSFTDVLDIYHNLDIAIFKDSIATPLQYLFDAEERRSPGNFACRHWNTVKNLPSKTFGCIYSIVNSALENLFTPTIIRLMNKRNKVNISSLGKQKTILFLTTSPVNAAADRFANLFYGDLFKNLYETAQELPNNILPIPVRVFCDDFAVTAKIPYFSKYISVFRSSGISAILLLQSESQLTNLYGPAEATTIINNCDTYVYMGGNDLTTAEHMSRRINLPLEDILYAPLGQIFIFRRGSKPIITERYPIFEDELYIEIEREMSSPNAELSNI